MKYTYKDTSNKMQLVETNNVEDLRKIVEQMWKPIRKRAINNYIQLNAYNLYETCVKIIPNEKGYLATVKLKFYLRDRISSNHSLRRQFYLVK